MTYEFERGMGALGDGDFLEAFNDFGRFMSGDRILPSGPSKRFMTRLSFYSFALQLGLKPYQIEEAFSSEEALVAAIGQADQAVIDVEQLQMRFGTSIGSSVAQFVSQFASEAGAQIGLIISALTQAIVRSQDCVEGVTQQYANSHRRRLFEKVREATEYFHDGFDYNRNGQPTDEGIFRNYKFKAQVASILPAFVEENRARRQKVDFIVGWLRALPEGKIGPDGELIYREVAANRHNPYFISESGMLTLYGMLACMSDAILNQPTEKEKKELGGIYYASLLNMFEVWWRLVGLEKTENANWCRENQQQCRVGVGSGGKATTTCTAQPKHIQEFCNIFTKDVYRGDKTVVTNWLGQVQPPQWTQFAKYMNPDSFITTKLKPVVERTRTKQDRYWQWDTNVGRAPARYGTIATGIPILNLSYSPTRQSEPEGAGVIPWSLAALGLVGGGVLLYFLFRNKRKNPMSLTVEQMENLNDAMEHLEEARMAIESGNIGQARLHSGEAALHAELLPQPLRGTVLRGARDIVPMR